MKRAKRGEPPGRRDGAARSGFPFPEKSLDFSAKRCYHKTKGVSTGSLSATDRNIRICLFCFPGKESREDGGEFLDFILKGVVRN